MAEPAAPKRTVSKAYDPMYFGPVRAYPEGFSRWDFLEVREGSLTYLGLAEHFKRAHGLELSMLTAGPLILYNPVFKSHRGERAGTPVVDVYRQVAAGKPGDKKRAAPEIAPGRNFLLLDAFFSDAAGCDVVIPTIKFYFA